MCTCLIAGKKAAVSGNAILAANDDWEGCPGILTHVAGAVHEEDEMLVLTGGQQIPQSRETCGYVYTACKYTVGTLDRAWAGGMNDRGVAVAGTGVDAYRPVPWKNEGYLLEPDDIPLLVLQRGMTARQAVRLIGDLINMYGLRPSYVEGAAGSSAATFSIADREEGWVLEVYPGRCWAAVRIPDDCVSVRVNAFGTHDADLTDTDNTMSSPGLAAYARGRGLWDGDERHFDFAAAFGSETSPTEWGPEKDPMNLLRRWSAMYLVDGREEAEDTLRYIAKPAHGNRRTAEQIAERNEAEDRSRGQIGIQDMMSILSDVYENTPYDLTRVPESGSEHDPFADGVPYYALCRQYTVASFVTDYAGKKGEPLMWTAMGIPRLVPYIPVWVDTDGLPECCEKLEREMKKYCDRIRMNYAHFAAAAEEQKKEYQKKMAALVQEEAGTEQNGRADRTRQNDSHILESVFMFFPAAAGVQSEFSISQT